MQRIPFLCPMASSELAALWIAAVPARPLPFLENSGSVWEPWIPAVPVCTVQHELNESPEELWGSSCVESILMLEYLQVTEPIWRPATQPLPSLPSFSVKRERKEGAWAESFYNLPKQSSSSCLFWCGSTMCCTPASSLEEGGLDWALLRVCFGLVLF